jgi:large subunit ribosomal protein L34
VRFSRLDALASPGAQNPGALTGPGVSCSNRGFPARPATIGAAFGPQQLLSIIMKRTYQASKVRRSRTHGFLVRMKTRGGRAVINARRAKGRKRLAV